MGVLNVLHVWSREYEVVSSGPDTLTSCDVDEAAELQYTPKYAVGVTSQTSYVSLFSLFSESPEHLLSTE